MSSPPRLSSSTTVVDFFELRDCLTGVGSAFFLTFGLSIFSGALSVVLEALFVCPRFLVDAK